MAGTGKPGGVKRAGRAAPAISSSRAKTAALRSQSAATKVASVTSLGAEGHRLVQLSVRVTEADRLLVHRTAMDCGMDAQKLVITALQAYGVDVGKGTEIPVRSGQSSPQRADNPEHGKPAAAAGNGAGGCMVVAAVIREMTELVLAIDGRSKPNPGPKEPRRASDRRPASHSNASRQSRRNGAKP